MPAHRLPRLRRPVAVLCALIVSLVLAWLGPVPGATAYPYLDDGPQLTLPTDATFVVGRPGDAYTIEADGDPVPAIGVDTLPAGLRLIAHGDGSATLTGTPTGPPGATDVMVRAQSAAGSTSETLTVSVQQAPAFTLRTPLVFRTGAYASVQVIPQGYPAPGIGLDGDLPAGLTFFDHGDGTATIAGTPVDGPTTAPVTLTAVNVVSDAALVTTIQVVVGAEAIDAPTAPTTTVQSSGGPRRAP